MAHLKTISIIGAILLGVLFLWMTWGRSPETQPPPVKTVTRTVKAVGSGNFQTLHTVQKGESLFSIARKHGVSVSAIQNANQNKSELIKVGQILVIPKR